MKLDNHKLQIHALKLSTSASAQTMIWLIFALILIYIGPTNWTLIHLITWSIFNTLLYAALANINLFVLFPKYLQNSSFIIYLASLLGICLLATPLKQLVNQYLCNLESGSCAFWITDTKFHFISLIIIASLSTLVRLPLDWLLVQNEKRLLQTKNIESELQFLKNQINPHFLFNTLNNLYALTLKKSDYAPELVLKLSDMLRYMLYECNESEVLLSKEIHYIKNYLDLEKIRLSQHADINIEIQGHEMNYKVAPLIFIPFIENSFKHGLKYSSSNAFINIQFKIEDRLQFSITNSKASPLPGFSIPKTVGGIGLTNVKKRLDLIYPNQYVLLIEDQPDQYKVSLTLLQQNQKI